MTPTARGGGTGLLLPSNRNKIINGCFRVWQRGTSFVRGASGAGYSPDRWYTANITDGQITFSKETAILPDGNTSACLKAACNTIDTSLANQFCIVNQLLEGYNFLPLWGKTCVLSFWARSNKIGTYCVSLTNLSGTYYSYIAEYSIDTANTWKKYYVILPIVPGGGTWDFTNGVGCAIRFALESGSGNYQGVVGWQSDATYSKVATVNQTHFMDTNTNVFYLANVQLEALDATTFEDRSFQDELRFCQRYFWSSYSPGYYPGQTGITTLQGLSDSIGYACFDFALPVSMRAVPVVHGYAPNTGTIDKGTNWSYTGYPDCTLSISGSNNMLYGYLYSNQVASSGYWLGVNVTAESEL